MIGFYDYTVVLTYLSLLSAGSGIFLSLSGGGHPFLGMFCLLLCGLCDSFDGIVARTKKTRTDTEKKYGIQIDSLSDVIAFGVLPACIGVALLRGSELPDSLFTAEGFGTTVLVILFYAVSLIYILAALIRLAYFNVTEEIRQKEEDGKPRKQFTGLPVTSSALILPVVMIIDFLLKSVNLTIAYYAVLFLMSFAFLLKFKMRKPGKRGVLIMIGLGVVEALLLILGYLVSKGII